MMAHPKFSSVIEQGPSREELFDALRLHAEHRKVSFVLTDNGVSYKKLTSILSIEAETNTGEDWIIEISLHVDNTHVVASGRHNTHRRKGGLREGYNDGL